MRAVSISLFYAIGTGAGGFIAPALFGCADRDRQPRRRGGRLCGRRDVGDGGRTAGARYAVDAERKPLEEVASLPH